MGLINIPDRRIRKSIGMPQIDWDDPLNRGLVGHWGMYPYEFGGKVVHDLSENGNTGTLVADTHWVPGKFGSALDFDGTGDYVDVGNVGATGDWTISFVAKQTANSSAIHYPIGTVGSSGVIMGGTHASFLQRFGFFDGASNIKTAENSVVTNVWYQVTVTKKGTTYSVYVDGVFKVGGTLNDIDISDMDIGRRADAVYFAGIIDYVYVYNRALSASEIALLCRRPF